MTRLTATEVARHFSAILNRVAAGEEVEITRAGAAVAVMGPARRRHVSVARLREIVAGAPAPDEAFAADIGSIRRESGVPESRWDS
jgi:prevent-host-death family protein